LTKYAFFEKIISILIIINLIGCTSLQPIKAQPDELQNQIKHGHLVKVDDNVRIFTEDGKEHRLRVTSSDTNEIVGIRVTSNEEKDVWDASFDPSKSVGEIVTIPVDSIVGLETEEYSGGRTFLAGSVGIVAGFMLLLFILLSGEAFMPSM
jgi:hypothetical protein